MSTVDSSGSGERIRVVVRCRPLSKSEIRSGYKSIVEVDSARGSVSLSHPDSPQENARQFSFDAAYGSHSRQSDLYSETFSTLVDSVMNGFNGTIFAYGQTGTGKTFTMEGVAEDEELRGVIPRSFDQIFQHIAASSVGQFLVRASYMEIYQERIRDLLHADQSRCLELRERPDTGVYVRDLTSSVCSNVAEMKAVMTKGNANRSVGATNMNEHSSRSHALFIATVEYAEPISACSDPSSDHADGGGTVSAATPQSGDADSAFGTNSVRFRVGKLNLVDLAGSERQSKTGASGERFKEATKINLSLSALGNVISALVDGQCSHVPYRDSKLTRLLQDSLGGNARTVMVSNIGPASYNYDETLSTLRYASRAKSVKNRPHVNEDAKDALLRQFQTEIEQLKAQLQAKSGAEGGSRRRRRRADADVAASDQTVDSDYIDQQRHLLEAERTAINNNKSLIAEERSSLLERLREREEQLDEQLHQQRTLMSRIQAIQSKLLSGTGAGGDGGATADAIKNTTNQQEQQLQQHRRQLAEQKIRERQVLQELEQVEEGRLDVQQTFTSLQHELIVKNKQLKKLFRRLEAGRRDLTDAEEEFSRERRDLQSLQQQIHKEYKLKSLLLDRFVSTRDRGRVQDNAVYDEDTDQWQLTPSWRAECDTPSPSARSVGAPLSLPMLIEQFREGGWQGVGAADDKLTKLVMRSGAKSVRHPALQLDPVGGRILQYRAPAVPDSVRAALSAALTPAESELSVDAASSLHVASFLQRAARKPSSLQSPSPATAPLTPTSPKPSALTASSTEPLPGNSDSSKRRGSSSTVRNSSSRPSSHYPQSRGLVPK